MTNVVWWVGGREGGWVRGRESGSLVEREGTERGWESCREGGDRERVEV